MPDLALANLNHVALTVNDLQVSIPWYEKVFGIQFQMDAPHQGGVGKLFADAEWKLIIVLHHHDAHQREAFQENRTGLDHVGFSVPTRADLLAWQAHLESLGVTKSPIADMDYGSVLVFRDPDNIQLELFSAPGT